MPAPKINACLNILRRTPAKDIDENVLALASLLSPDEVSIDELFQRVDTPLKDASDPITNGKKYLLCDHNRDGESHRSPWSNTYHPSISGDDNDGFKPSHKLRELEKVANEVFDSYCELYYGKDSISSVYLWDKVGESTYGGNSSGFFGCFLIKNSVVTEGNSLKSGFWNSTHVVDVGSVSGGKAIYKLTSTILLSMDPAGVGKDDELNIGGSFNRQVEKICPVLSTSDGAGHVANIGKLIEEIEIDMRSSMDALYIQKTREVIDSIWSSTVDDKKLGVMASMMSAGKQNAMILNQAISNRNLKKT